MRSSLKGTDFHFVGSVLLPYVVTSGDKSNDDFFRTNILLKNWYSAVYELEYITVGIPRYSLGQTGPATVPVVQRGIHRYSCKCHSRYHWYY